MGGRHEREVYMIWCKCALFWMFIKEVVGIDVVGTCSKEKLYNQNVGIWWPEIEWHQQVG